MFLDSYYRFKYPEFFYFLLISLLLGVCVGLFLGLEHLIKELGKEGTWKINLPKLILVGLPSLYFSLANVWVLSGNRFMQESLYLNRYGSDYVSLFQMIFGYVVITSFFKYNEKI